jgi:hypothetical protein
VRVENGAKLSVTLPSSRVLYVRSPMGEAEITLKPREVLAFEKLALAPPSARVRGALDVAMKRGLFATGFGPNYYRGFIDRARISWLSPSLPRRRFGGDGDNSTGRARRAGVRPRAAIAPSFSAAGSPKRRGGTGRDDGAASRAAPARSLGLPRVARRRLGPWTFAEWQALASAGYQLGLRKRVPHGRRARSTGVAGQKTIPAVPQSTETSSWTATIVAAPSLGASYQVGARFAVGVEATLNVLGFRRIDDGTFTVSLLPTAYAGLTMGL